LDVAAQIHQEGPMNQLGRWALLGLVLVAAILCYGVGSVLDNVGYFLFNMAEKMASHALMTKQKINKARE
jgi:hypothetical protein